MQLSNYDLKFIYIAILETEARVSVCVGHFTTAVISDDGL